MHTDYIDLYFLHRDNPSCPVEVIIDALEEEVKKGRIRYYGCSNWKPERILKANSYARSLGGKGFVVNQAMYSLADVSWSGVEDKTLEAMDKATLAFQREEGMDVMAYSSIAKGYFSKRAKGIAQRPLEDAVYGNETNEEIWKVMKPYLSSFKPVDIELQYLLSFRDPHIIPIVSFSSEQQLEEGFHAEEVCVPESLISRLAAMKQFVL